MRGPCSRNTSSGVGGTDAGETLSAARSAGRAGGAAGTKESIRRAFAGMGVLMVVLVAGDVCGRLRPPGAARTGRRADARPAGDLPGGQNPRARASLCEIQR